MKLNIFYCYCYCHSYCHSHFKKNKQKTNNCFNQNHNHNNNCFNNNNNNQQDNVTYNMGEIKSIRFQFNISIFELSKVTGSIIKYTSILITVCKN